MEANIVNTIVEDLRQKLGLQYSKEEMLEMYRAEVCENELPEPKESLPDVARKRYFPWRDVLASMLDNPESVVESGGVCPVCGAALLEMKFSSPYWTWRELCGRGGMMHICTACPSQVDFKLTVMN